LAIVVMATSRATGKRKSRALRRRVGSVHKRLGPMTLFCCSYTKDGARYAITLPAMEADADLLLWWGCLLDDFQVDGRLVWEG